MPLVIVMLFDIKVIDLTQFIAGPYCTKLLADYGASVIKVEKPGAGDGARRLGPFPADDPDPEKSGLFIFLNTNKRGVTLNLKSPDGAGILRRLAATADVLVESFRPGVMAGLGLDYPSLSKLNPRLVYTSISNFGQTGPYRDYRATELISEALGGVLDTSGEADREPVKFAGYQAQFHGGLVAAPATMGALWHSLKTGHGQQVDVSLMEAEINIHELQIMVYPYAGQQAHKRMGSYVGHYPWSIYPCKDGWVALCVNNRQWRRVGNWLGMLELSRDPKYATPAERFAHFGELEAIIVPALAEQTRAEAVARGQAAGVPILPVSDPAEVMQDPQFKARDYFIDIAHPRAGSYAYPGLPFKVKGTASRGMAPAPLLGQHNKEVYCRELGYSGQDLVRLRQMGVI
ncbi:MAG: CoA transferase [Chloroflexi bacterium]|nr:CoA transferase [Chloroflexota bacterium]